MRETLRLFPPAWGTGRECIEEDTIGGYRIPARSILTTLFFVAQKDPQFWEEPERFDPDRFLPERSEGRPAEAWSPFGLGGRSCIGEDFALMEATVVLATLARRLRLHRAPRFLDGVDEVLQSFTSSQRADRPLRAVAIMLEPP